VVKRRIFLQIAFDGRAYSGWQLQPGKPTVMEVMDDALSRLHGRRIRVHGCARTDAGVHAAQFFLHFMDHGDVKDNLPFRLNALLPPDMRAVSLHRELPDTAHARFDVLERTYRYHVHLKANPFLDPYSLFFPWGPPDIAAMEKLAGSLLGITNFQMLTRRSNGPGSAICQLTESRVVCSDDGGSLYYQVTSDRFLTGMVRRIMGLLLQVGMGKVSSDEAFQYLEAGRQPMKGLSVPPHGLFLWKVTYPFLMAETADPEVFGFFGPPVSSARITTARELDQSSRRD